MHLYLKLCLNTIQKWLELCQYSWGHIIDWFLQKNIGYLWQCYANNTNIEVTWCVINNDLRECTGTQLWQLHTLAPYWWIGLWGKCEVYIYMLTLCKCCVGGHTLIQSSESTSEPESLMAKYCSCSCRVWTCWMFIISFFSCLAFLEFVCMNELLGFV